LQQQWGEQSEKRPEEKRRSGKRKAEERRSGCVKKVEESQNTVFFQCLVAPRVEKEAG